MKTINSKIIGLMLISLTTALPTWAVATSKDILKCSASYANTYSQKWVMLDDAMGIEVPKQGVINGESVKQTEVTLNFKTRGADKEKRLGINVVVKAAIVDADPLGEKASLGVEIQIPEKSLSIVETSSDTDMNYGKYGHMRKEYQFNSDGVAHLVSCDLKKQ